MADVTVGETLDIGDPSTYIPTAFGVGRKAIIGGPADQIIASLLIAAFAIGSSYVTFGVTLLIVPIALLFAFIGFVRLLLAAIR